MKKILLIALVALSGSQGVLHADSVNIELDAGILRNTTGSSPVALQGLLQIVFNPTSTSATFSQLNAGSFQSGTDQVALSLAMNYNSNPNVNGETDNIFPLTVNSVAANNSATSLDVGEPILLRWFPQFLLSNNTIIRNPNPLIGGTGPNTPQVGDFYGQFRSTTGELGGIPWTAPTGGSYLLVFNTVDAGGAHPNTDGYATIAVLAGAGVPEPSTYALLGLGLGALTFGAMQQRRRRQAAC